MGGMPLSPSCCMYCRYSSFLSSSLRPSQRSVTRPVPGKYPNLLPCRSTRISPGSIIPPPCVVRVQRNLEEPVLIVAALRVAAETARRLRGSSPAAARRRSACGCSLGS
eukprot:4061066-Prymnesium_polylepis.1